MIKELIIHKTLPKHWSTNAVMTDLIILEDTLDRVPSLISHSGEQAVSACLEFFTAHIRNPNTRRAYARTLSDFSDWCSAHGLRLESLKPVHIAAYIEQMTKEYEVVSVKQSLAAIRGLFDFMVVRQAMPSNPAMSVRAPRFSRKKGKTPIPSHEEARKLLESIPSDSIMGLRDRALIATMLYSFARVGAALSLQVGDYFPQGKRWWLRLHEKGGKEHEMPAHHCLEEYLDAYIEAAGIGDQKKSPLFRSMRGRVDRISDARMRQADAWRMIRKRALMAGIDTELCCHSFRAFGITAYLENGGTLEKAQTMAAHESPHTTKLYDRTSDTVSLDEVEKIVV